MIVYCNSVCMRHLFFIIFSLQNKLVLIVLARLAGEGFCTVDSSFWNLHQPKKYEDRNYNA